MMVLFSILLFDAVQRATAAEYLALSARRKVKESPTIVNVVTTTADTANMIQQRQVSNVVVVEDWKEIEGGYSRKILKNATGRLIHIYFKDGQEVCGWCH